MKSTSLRDMTVGELVQRFAVLAIQQDDALLANDGAEVNRLFWLLAAIDDELKLRQGDQRKALIDLYNHANMQVRLKAATATLAVAPQAARIVLEAISASKQQPQALDAGMSLRNLDSGVFKPI